MQKNCNNRLMELDETDFNEAPSMLLSFRGINIRSFKDEFEVSLVATTLSEGNAVRTVPWRGGTTASSKIGVLPAAAFYGANGSGKSNVLRAMEDMRNAVLNSFRSWPATGGTRRKPFLLGKSREAPTLFEIQLVLEGVLHTYGFEMDDEVILREWAYRHPHGRAQIMFERDANGIRIGSKMRPTLGAVRDVVRSNSLFLSTAVALRNSELLPLYNWFRRNLLLADIDSREARQLFTVHLLEDHHRETQIRGLLAAADLGIVGVEKMRLEPSVREKLEQVAAIFAGDDQAPAGGEVVFTIPDGTIGLVHRGEHEDVRFDMSEESLGTAVWLGLVGPIVDALENGSVLLVDELDASLHPHLVRQIVELFQNHESNPHRAQIVFNSHDATLLGNSPSERVLGRDQVWFVEKGSTGASRLTSLSDMNPRNAEAVEKRYLSGRYGGVPLVARGEFQDAIFPVKAEARA